MPSLRGHGCIWHRCTVEGLQGIVKAGAILPAGQTTEKSCVTDCQAHRLGAVPVFDFDGPTEPEVYRAAKMGWAHFMHDDQGLTDRIGHNRPEGNGAGLKTSALAQNGLVVSSRHGGGLDRSLSIIMFNLLIP